MHADGDNASQDFDFRSGVFEFPVFLGKGSHQVGHFTGHLGHFFDDLMIGMEDMASKNQVGIVLFVNMAFKAYGTGTLRLEVQRDHPVLDAFVQGKNMAAFR